MTEESNGLVVSRELHDLECSHAFQETSFFFYILPPPGRDFGDYEWSEIAARHARQIKFYLCVLGAFGCVLG